MSVRARRISLAVAVAAVILLAQVGINVWQHAADDTGHRQTAAAAAELP